jgi:hypothetical protein
LLFFVSFFPVSFTSGWVEVISTNN